MERWESSLTRRRESWELGPSLELARDGVMRPSLHNNPPWHETASLVSALT